MEPISLPIPPFTDPEIATLRHRLGEVQLELTQEKATSAYWKAQYESVKDSGPFIASHPTPDLIQWQTLISRLRAMPEDSVIEVSDLLKMIEERL